LKLTNLRRNCSIHERLFTQPRVGDEVAVIIVGQGHQRAVELAEAVRRGVESLSLEYKSIALPKVTASIGVATTPPAEREMEIKSLAESRKRQGKEKGRNRIISS
jgi:diguanylate cyclase (GGDEF)-like protein